MECGRCRKMRAVMTAVGEGKGEDGAKENEVM